MSNWFFDGFSNVVWAVYPKASELIQSLWKFGENMCHTKHKCNPFLCPNNNPEKELFWQQTEFQNYHQTNISYFYLTLGYGPFGVWTFLSGSRKNSGNTDLLKTKLKLSTSSKLNLIVNFQIFNYNWRKQQNPIKCDIKCILKPYIEWKLFIKNWSTSAIFKCVFIYHESTMLFDDFWWLKMYDAISSYTAYICSRGLVELKLLVMAKIENLDRNYKFYEDYKIL